MLREQIQPIESSTQKQERTEPERIGLRRYAGTVQDEVAIPVCKECGDLCVTSSRNHLFPDLLAQIVGKIGMRIRNGLILANETAKLLRECHDALVEIRGAGWLEQHCQQQQRV